MFCCVCRKKTNKDIEELAKKGLGLQEIAKEIKTKCGLCVPCIQNIVSDVAHDNNDCCN